MPPAAVDLAIGLLRSGRAVATAAGHTPLHSAAPLVSSYLIAGVGISQPCALHRNARSPLLQIRASHAAAAAPAAYA